MAVIVLTELPWPTQLRNHSQAQIQKTDQSTNVVTNSMEKSLFWYASSCSASQENPAFMQLPRWNSLNKDQPLAHILSQLSQYVFLQPTFTTSVLVLACHLCLGLHNIIFPYNTRWFHNIYIYFNFKCLKIKCTAVTFLIYVTKIIFPSRKGNSKWRVTWYRCPLSPSCRPTL